MKDRCLTYLALAVVFLISSCSLSQNTGPRFSVGRMVFSTPIESAHEIKWKNVSRQTLDISCGPAALATIINFYLGEQVTEMEIISRILKTSDMAKIKKIQKRQAFSLLDLKRYAGTRGYQAAGYRVSIQDLINFGKPVIIPIETLGYRHFVVFKGIRGDRIFIADPAFGNMTMRYPHFMHAWKQRVALVIDDRRKKTDELAHGLSLEGLDGVYVDDSVHRLLIPRDIFIHSPPGSF